MKRDKLNIMFRILLAAVAVTLYSSGMAQNYIQDMQKIRESYKNNYHSFRIKFVFYPYDSLAVASDSMKGYCKIQGNDYYYDMSDGRSEYEYLKNGKYYLVVDHVSKVVALSTSSRSRPQLWNLNAVDSLLNTKSMKISYKDLDNDKGQYELSYTGRASWNRMVLTFNKANNTMTSIFLYSDARGKMYKQSYAKPRVGIYYYDYSESTEGDNTFSESKYLHVENEKTVLADSYKGYKLLDYIHSKRQ